MKFTTGKFDWFDVYVIARLEFLHLPHVRLVLREDWAPDLLLLTAYDERGARFVRAAIRREAIWHGDRYEVEFVCRHAAETFRPLVASTRAHTCLVHRWSGDFPCPSCAAVR